MPSVSAHVLQYANTSRAVEHIGQASAHGRVQRWAARRGRLAAAVPGPAEKKSASQQRPVLDLEFYQRLFRSKIFIYNSIKSNYQFDN